MTKPVSHANAGESMHHLQKRFLGCYSQKDRYNSNNRDWGGCSGENVYGTRWASVHVNCSKVVCTPRSSISLSTPKYMGISLTRAMMRNVLICVYALQQETQTTKKRISLVLKDGVDDVGPGEGGVGGLGGGLGLLGRGSFQRKLIDIGNYIYH